MSVYRSVLQACFDCGTVLHYNNIIIMLIQAKRVFYTCLKRQAFYRILFRICVASVIQVFVQECVTDKCSTVHAFGTGVLQDCITVFFFFLMGALQVSG